MTKGGILRKLGWLLLGIVALLAVVYIAIVITTNRMLAAVVTVPATVQPVSIPEGNTAAIERGQYLVDHLLNCKVCHAPDFGGRAEIDDAMIGTLWGPNLTAGQGSVTRDYAPVDWVRALQHGLDPTGRRLVLMPSEDFVTFSNEDIGAVIAYVKSMPPVDREDRGIKLGPLGRVLFAAEQITFAYDKIDHAAARPDGRPGPTAEWGEVLIGACRGCHGEGLSGGPIPGGDPAWPPARNLTPHETGLKGWTFDQFSQALRQGQRPDGTQLGAAMPWRAYAGMTDSDSQAIWQYVSTRATPKEMGGR